MAVSPVLCFFLFVASITFVPVIFAYRGPDIEVWLVLSGRDTTKFMKLRKDLSSEMAQIRFTLLHLGKNKLAVSPFSVFSMPRRDLCSPAALLPLEPASTLSFLCSTVPGVSPGVYSLSHHPTSTLVSVQASISTPSVCLLESCYPCRSLEHL